MRATLFSSLLHPDTWFIVVDFDSRRFGNPGGVTLLCCLFCFRPFSLFDCVVLGLGWTYAPRLTTEIILMQRGRQWLISAPMHNNRIVKKSLAKGDKNLIEFLKGQGWFFWIFPPCAAWGLEIKSGICGEYSQMACNEWLSFSLMVTKQSKTTVCATFGSNSKLHFCLLSTWWKLSTTDQVNNPLTLYFKPQTGKHSNWDFSVMWKLCLLCRPTEGRCIQGFSFEWPFLN